MIRRSPDRDLLDAFLDDPEALEGLALVAEALPRVPAPTGLGRRVLESARLEGRFTRYAEITGELLDLPPAAALALLDQLDDERRWEPGFVPGMQLCHVQGGPKVSGAITGFVRLAQRHTFPDHEHLGAESVLILQGRCLDRDQVHGPGDVVHMEAGSRHEFTVLKGPDLLYLAVVHEGLRVGDDVLRADDPRA